MPEPYDPSDPASIRAFKAARSRERQHVKDQRKSEKADARKSASERRMNSLDDKYELGWAWSRRGLVNRILWYLGHAAVLAPIIGGILYAIVSLFWLIVGCAVLYVVWAGVTA